MPPIPRRETDRCTASEIVNALNAIDNVSGLNYSTFIIAMRTETKKYQFSIMSLRMVNQTSFLYR